MPPSRDAMPALCRMWWISETVVDLPFVPVTPTTLCAGKPARACANSSISPMIGTPAARACAATGCRLSGTPGETTSASNPARSMLSGSASERSSPARGGGPFASSGEGWWGASASEPVFWGTPPPPASLVPLPVPGRTASLRPASESHATTLAPLADSARTAAAPERASPSTANLLPAQAALVITAASTSTGRPAPARTR